MLFKMHFDFCPEMGAKRGAFTQEDIEAFKYTYNRISMYRFVIYIYRPGT